MIIFLGFTAVLAVGYAAIVLRLFFGVRKLKKGENTQQHFVSVIVAARNEEQNIGLCLEALTGQTCPADSFEIIIVDDRSSDGTAAIVEEFRRRAPNVKLIQIEKVPAGIAPKKNAIAQGIDAARGEIILTTDADCAPAPGWVEALVSYFEPDVGFVAGFSPLEDEDSKSVISKLFTLDSLSLAAVAAGGFGLGRPLTCSGRNLAYRKETFREVGGFKEIQHFVSGDDDLLLHLVSSRTRWKMQYAASPGAIVRSKAPSSFRQFANQRIRHASKGRHYSAWLILCLAGVYLLNLNLLLLFLLSLTFSKFLLYWLGLLLVKSAPEFLLIFRVAAIFNYKKVLNVFPLAMLLHVPYVVIFGLWGQLGKFRWKDETFDSRANRD